MTFSIRVVQTDIYSKDFKVEAATFEEAKTIVQEELEACPLDTQSNTLESSDEEIYEND